MLWPQSPAALDLNAPLAAPSPAHPLGTDELGRDMLARLMQGGRTTLAVSLPATLLALAAGALLGLAAGLAPTLLGAALMRLLDAALALPPLVVLLAVAALAPNQRPLTLALLIALVAWPAPARLIRAEVIGRRDAPYILAARQAGGSPLYIARVHLLPAMAGLLAASAAFLLGDAIVTLSGLSFLGLGIEPPAASWGGLLAAGLPLADLGAWWLTLPPAALIVGGVLLAGAPPTFRTSRAARLGAPGPRRREAAAQGTASEGGHPLLVVNNLSVTYPGQSAAALAGVSLHLAAGDILALTGPSGAGKTTLALAILGLLPEGATVTGTIAFAGRDIRHARRGADIAMAFQNAAAALNPAHRIATQIAEPARLHLGAVPEVEHILLALGFAEPAAIARRYPHELSGGQRQRVMLARALAARPRLLIADEPTAALDDDTACLLLDALEAARGRGTAILLITHDLARAAARADRMEELPSASPAAPPLPARAPPPRGEILLTARDITVRYAPRLFAPPPPPSLTGVSFDLRAGECLGIVGPSGAGKTTLARAVLQLLPYSGEMRLAGEDPARDAAARRRIQPVFQEPAQSLNPRFAVRRAVTEPAAIAGRNASAEALQRRVGLPAGLAPRPVTALSAGQAQRVAIARALAAEPALLVLDEPCSALDAASQAQIYALLRNLLAEGLALLLITHDLAAAQALCHRVLRLQNGRVENGN